MRVIKIWEGWLPYGIAVGGIKVHVAKTDLARAQEVLSEGETAANEEPSEED